MPAPKTYPETVSHREFFRFAAHSEWQVFHEATMRALVAQLAAESEYWTQPEWGEKFATPAASSFIPALSDETRPNARDKIATWWRIGH
ncbi:MAG TPA: hypothetical protein PLZ79_04770, partial [Burkholderiales bacterium]|nr:hypothetical protein [Burkholderiales bacterium]